MSRTAPSLLRSFAIVPGGASLLRCSSCCGRSGHPFEKSSGEGALNSKCSSYYKTINALLQLHPGKTRSFFFCGAEKESSATCEGKRWGCGCSVDACGGSIVDWRTTAYALFHCMDQRVAPPKCLWQMLVALQSEAAPRFGQWVQTRRTRKWWCRWVAQWEHSFCSVMLLVWKTAHSWPKLSTYRQPSWSEPSTSFCSDFG